MLIVLLLNSFHSQHTHTDTHTHTIFRNTLISSKSNGKTSITFPLSYKLCNNNESGDYISVCRFFNIFPAEKFASDGQLISSFHSMTIYLYFFLWNLIFKLSLSVELMLCPHIVFFFKYKLIYFNWRLIIILYWFCHTSTWIRRRYTHVPHPEPPSLLPPHTIPLGRLSAPAPSSHCFYLWS